MRADTKKAKLAALLGIEIKKPPTAKELEQGTISREAEGVIAFGNRTQRFTQRECIQCGGIFAVNRSNISCCSDICRKHHLEFKFGIVWDPNARTLEERWSAQTGGPEPLIVPARVLPLIEIALENHIRTEQQQTLQSLDELLSWEPADVV